MKNIKPWIKSFRLRTLPLSLSSVFMGSIVAAREGTFRWEVFILVSITTLFLQILSNISNDYGDSVSGVDNENRLGPERMVQSGLISKKSMKNAIIICALLAFISGIILIFIAFNGIKIGTLLFLLLGLMAIAAAILYTIGRNPYGYKGLGDVFVFLFFGITGVAGSYFLHCLSWNWVIILPACTIGFFSTAVLNLNNIRDIQSDRESGKNTLAVKIGRYAASWYHFALISAGWLCFLIFIKMQGGAYLLTLLTLPLFIRNIWIVFEKNDTSVLNLELRNLSLMTLLFVGLSAI